MKSECKAEMKSEKSLLTNFKDTINSNVAVSLYKTEKSEKRDEKLKSESEWEPEDENIDL